MNTWLRPGLLLLLCRVAGGVPTAFVSEPPAGPPTWFLEHLAEQTREGGRWIADNAEYRSDSEPFDAYGTEWRYGIGKQSMLGRLFGMKDGEEVGDFWEFRVFWHAGEQKAYIYQFGADGTVGIGNLESSGSGMTQSAQVFHHPDGTQTRNGHKTHTDEEGGYHTDSFDILEDESWKPRRRYLWHLE